MTSKEIKDLRKEIFQLKCRSKRILYCMKVLKGKKSKDLSSHLESCLFELEEKRKELKQAIHEKLTK